MKITLLGTGTSQGVPVIGCECAVCRSSDPRDNRLRCSILVSDGETNILVDVGPDLRQQMLRTRTKHLDSILITHEHNDHVIGLDDVRPFNFSSGRAMQVFAEERVAHEIRRRFDYVFGEPIPGLPKVSLHPLFDDSDFYIGGVHVQALRIMHGKLPILGFRFGKIAYITDMKTIPQQEIEKLAGIETLIVNALHHDGHYSHMNLTEALAFVEKIQPNQAYLTHISHRMGLHEIVSAGLPNHVALAYDGLVLE